MTTFQGTETYLIECSRENSAINIDDDDDTNGSWANETDFVIKRGDRISVEMVCANIRGSGTSAPTIEFSGQNVVVNGSTKKYCDTKVLMEVFFYMNNNNTYSVGMPLIHPFGGINGRGGSGNYDNLVTPTNINPRIPKGNVTNQVCNYREVNMGMGYVYPSEEFGDWGIWDGTAPEPVYMNQPGNELPPAPFFTSQDPTVVSVKVEPWRRAYQIYQFEYEIAGVKTWGAPSAPLPALPNAGDRICAIRITPHAAVLVPQVTPPYQTYNGEMNFTDYENGILQGRTGQDYQNNFYVGNHIFISDNIDPTTDILQTDWVGQIAKIKGIGGLGTPSFNMKVLQLDLEPNNAAGTQQEFGFYSGAQSKFGFECGDCACYVGGIFVDNGGFVNPKFDIKPGSSQEGLINYDNLELSTIPQVAGTYAGNGYLRGNNALFMYSRNTRKPQAGQDSSLALFPDTIFEPDTVTGSSPAAPFYTTDAGEYGNLPASAEFGYRNANIQEENNNQPYIFMRNDHFGRGRRGMNNEKMPDAEPMSAFIYVSLKELLQDVNSVTNVINERLRETITGLGTTTQQTSKLLLNSIENPEQMKPASNVIPFYNRVGFYDKEVTADSQNTLMLDTNNAQYRNIITDIIPIKNGGCVKVNPANFTSGRNYLAQSYGKQYGGIPSSGLFGSDASQAQLNNIKETTYLREIETANSATTPITETYSSTVVVPGTPEQTITTPQPDLVVPQPDLVVPQPDLVTPQPDLVIPQPDLVTVIPAVPPQIINRNNTSDGITTLLTTTYDYNNSPPNIILTNSYRTFGDDGGLSADYTTSHSRCIIFDAGAGNKIMINPVNFHTEHSTFAMYDRIGITCSNTASTLNNSSSNLSNADSTLSQYLYQSSSSSPSTFWGQSWGNSGNQGDGWIFPNKSFGTDAKGNQNSSWVNTWYVIDARFIKIFFKSDGSAVEPGWEFRIARQENIPGQPAQTIVTPQPDLIVPQPDLVTPQPDLIVPQPDLLVPQPDLVTIIPATPDTTQVVSSTLVTDQRDLNQVNFQGWANPIYGNFATADLYKYQLGDRWANLPVWNCDRVAWTGGTEPLTRQVGKTIILNNKLEYKTLNFTFPQGLNGYTGELSNFPNAIPSDLICNTLYENQLIYTNIPFPQKDDDEGTWAKFAKAMRNYETYYNPSNNAPVDYKNQVKDVGNWIFDGDVGMTDDRSTAQLRTQLGAPRHEPPNTAPDYPVVTPPNPPPAVPVPRFQNNRPFYYDWINQPNPDAMLGADPIYGTSLGLPQPSQVPVPAGGEPDPDYRPAVYGANRTLICPTTSHEIFAGVSATNCVDEEEKYKILKELGRLKIKSRFNPNFYKLAKSYKGFTINDTTTIPNDHSDIGFRISNDPPDPDYKVNTDFIRQLDIGFYPYEYKRGDGSTVTMCAMMVGTDYTPSADKISTINFGSMVWGQSIGISNSFYDNHAICPMNNDQVKRGQPLTKTTQVPGEWVQVGAQDTINIEENEYYQAPSSTTPFAATLAYTQTLGYTAPRVKTEWDFTTNFLTAPYINTAGRFRCRLQFTNCLQYPGETATIIWEQGSNFNAAAVVDFVKVSTDTPNFYDPLNPAGLNFTGLYFNPLFNGDNTVPVPNPPTATNTWVLVSGTGIANFVPANPFANLGIGVFQARGLDEPGAYFNAFYDTGGGDDEMVQFAGATLSVYKQPTITPSTDIIEPNLGLQHNKVNYVWVGATQPTFQYAQEKGRVEFVQLQDDNILNQKSIPYSAGTINPSATTGTKAGIINTAAEDAVFSRNSREDDFVNSQTTTPVKNSGVRAEISGVGIYKIWLCPENYEPPNNINLSSYWNNAASGQNADGQNEISYWGQTNNNRQKIIKGCVEADEENWTGCLFERLGFQSHRELLPAYGKQQNRFNPTTYNETRPDKISRGTKPLILCNAVDNSIDPALNTFFTADTSATAVNGIPMYGNGMLNDESVSLQLVNQSLTASAPPILSTSPFLLIESDICSTNYRSGRTQQNVLFYLMKNYQASSFIYGYGSSYTHTANQDRMLSLINTAFRDPITGRLQKCSNNSTIIYKIQRDTIILPPTTDALGNPLPKPKPAQTESEKLLSQIVTNTDKQGSKGGGAIGTGTGGGSSSSRDVLPGLNVGLIGQLLENSGETGEIIQGNRRAEVLEATLTQIDNDPNIPTTEAEILSAVGFIIQRLLAKYPIELVRDPLTGMIGLANPNVKMDDAGSGMGGLVLENTAVDAYNLSQNVVEFLANSFDRLGGIAAIRDLMDFEAEDDGEGIAQELQELADDIVINPITGLQMGIYGEVDAEQLNEAGYLNFIGADGSSSFTRITQVFTSFLINQEGIQALDTFTDDEDFKKVEDRMYLENARLLDAAARVLSQSITAGTRVNLQDPAGEFLNKELFAPITGLRPERVARMNEVDFSQARSFEGFNPGFQRTQLQMERSSGREDRDERRRLKKTGELRDSDDDGDDERWDSPEEAAAFMRENTSMEEWEIREFLENNDLLYGQRQDINELQADQRQEPRMSGEAKRGYDNLKPLPSGTGGGTKDD